MISIKTQTDPGIDESIPNLDPLILLSILSRLIITKELTDVSIPNVDPSVLELTN